MTYGLFSHQNRGGAGVVVSKRSGPYADRGTWIHPDLSINLAQWCSAKIAWHVSKWVREWLTTGRTPALPDINTRTRHEPACRTPRECQLATFLKIPHK